MRCSALDHGCSAASHAPGETLAKDWSAAAGTAARLISRSSQQKGRAPASWRQKTARSGTPDGNVDALAVRPRRAAPFARERLEAIVEAERRDVGCDVADLEERRLAVRPGDEAAGLAPPLDEARAGKLGQRLADRHARAAVSPRQFVLEGDAGAGRPGAAEDLRLDVGDDPAVQRRRRRRAIARVIGYVGADGLQRLGRLVGNHFKLLPFQTPAATASRRRVAPNRAATLSRRGWRPSVDDLAAAAPDAIDEIARAGKDPGVEDRVVGAAGDERLIRLERYDVGARAFGDPPRRPAERLRAAGRRAFPEKSARRAAVVRADVARFAREALGIFEHSEFAGGR